MENNGEHKIIPIQNYNLLTLNIYNKTIIDNKCNTILPVEILYKIFNYSDPFLKLKFSTLCKNFYNIYNKLEINDKIFKKIKHIDNKEDNYNKYKFNIIVIIKHFNCSFLLKDYLNNNHITIYNFHNNYKYNKCDIFLNEMNEHLLYKKIIDFFEKEYKTYKEKDYYIKIKNTNYVISIPGFGRIDYNLVIEKIFKKLNFIKIDRIIFFTKKKEQKSYKYICIEDYISKLYEYKPTKIVLNKVIKKEDILLNNFKENIYNYEEDENITNYLYENSYTCYMDKERERLNRIYTGMDDGDLDYFPSSY